MNYKNIIIFLTIILYSCSPINKQHGYLLDDMLSSSDSMANFTINETKKSDIYATMGSPSVEIKDINKIWIYLISLKENNLLNEDDITFQTILRFEFDNSDNLVKKISYLRTLIQISHFQMKKLKLKEMHMESLINYTMRLHEVVKVYL